MKKSFQELDLSNAFLFAAALEDPEKSSQTEPLSSGGNGCIIAEAGRGFR